MKKSRINKTNKKCFIIKTEQIVEYDLFCPDIDRKRLPDDVKELPDNEEDVLKYLGYVREDVFEYLGYGYVYSIDGHLLTCGKNSGYFYKDKRDKDEKRYEEEMYEEEMYEEKMYEVIYER